MELFRWIAGLTSQRYRHNKNFLKNDDFMDQMITGLVINEIEKVVVQVEMNRVSLLAY